MYIVNPWATTTKSKIKATTDMLRKEKKQNKIKCSIKPQKAEKEWKTNIGTKNKGNK